MLDEVTRLIKQMYRDLEMGILGLAFLVGFIWLLQLLQQFDLDDIKRQTAEIARLLKERRECRDG